MPGTSSIGVDQGGTDLRAAVYAGDRTFLDTVTLPAGLEAGREQIVRVVCKAVTGLMARPSGNGELRGAAVVETEPTAALPGARVLGLRSALDTPVENFNGS